MNSLKINNLFDMARREAAPAVDVADAVIATLALYRQNAAAVMNRSLLWMSMASSAVAAGIVVAAMINWQHNADSVNELLNVVAWAAQ